MKKYNQLKRQMECLENYSDASFDKADHSAVLYVSPFYSDLCKGSERLSMCGPGRSVRAPEG